MRCTTCTVSAAPHELTPTDGLCFRCLQAVRDQQTATIGQLTAQLEEARRQLEAAKPKPWSDPL